jgi:hypothetical protein
MSDHPQAIPLDPSLPLGPNSAEIARVWINDEGRASVLIAAYLLEDPAIFGRLMSDVVRHAAVAYAGTWAGEEGEMLQAIVGGLSDALREQAGEITTVQDGRLD